MPSSHADPRDPTRYRVTLCGAPVSVETSADGPYALLKEHIDAQAEQAERGYVVEMRWTGTRAYGRLLLAGGSREGAEEVTIDITRLQEQGEA